MTHGTGKPAAPLRTPALGIPVILVGILATLLARSFDGLVKGLFLGAGIMLILLGTMSTSVLIRAQRTDADQTEATDSGPWLPSRDGDR